MHSVFPLFPPSPLPFFLSVPPSSCPCHTHTRKQTVGERKTHGDTVSAGDRASRRSLLLSYSLSSTRPSPHPTQMTKVSVCITLCSGPCETGRVKRRSTANYLMYSAILVLLLSLAMLWPRRGRHQEGVLRLFGYKCGIRSARRRRRDVLCAGTCRRGQQATHLPATSTREL